MARTRAIATAMGFINKVSGGKMGPMGMEGKLGAGVSERTLARGQQRRSEVDLSLQALYKLRKPAFKV